ncbi:MAG: hypothetical protein M1820_002427 [Bogoriella megaspora]|nr:MAG: hypothetical protein M1820_002427 [Bogoriella megaspora]
MPSATDESLRSLEQDQIEKETNGHILADSSPRRASESLETEIDLPPSPQVDDNPDEPPNGGYGWVCVACAFWINAHTWGLNSSYGVFLAHYLDANIYPGATYLEFAFIGGLSISQALFISPIATTTTRVFGTRTTLLIGVFFEVLALVGASFTKEIWQLFLSQGLCFGWGMGFLFVGSVGVIPQWFTTRRSLANATAASGSGFGGLIYSLATNAMIERISLWWAFRILGILAFTVNMVCALLMKDRNKQVGSSQLAFDYRLFKKVEYLLLLGWGFFSMLGYIVLLFSLPNFATEVGLTQQQGSVVGALLNLGQGLGRPPIGYFSDSIGRINMATLMTFCAGLFSLVVWIFAKSYGVLIFFALIGGAVAGTFWATIAPVTAEVMGLKRVPAALSIAWVVLVLPTTFSEPIALEIRNFDGNYLGAQLFTGIMYLAAAFCGWLLRTWKIGEMEMIAAKKGEQVDSVDAVADSPTAGDGLAPGPIPTSNFVKRMFMWKKV